MKGRPHLIPALVAAIMLIIAVFPLAYGYYQLLRWIICGIAVFTAIMAYQWGKWWAVGIFGVIAVLFNPLLVIHFTKQIWQPIDAVCAILFVVSIPLLKEQPKPSTS